MTRKLSVAVIAAALLMSGAMVGISFGGGSGITQPEVLELKFDLNSAEAQVRHFPLRDYEGKRGGQITSIKAPLFDAEGNKVGRQQIACTLTDETGWVCTWVSTIQDGPNTDKGTVVATGIYSGQVSTLAVTGGTGAYDNVGGRAKMVETNGPSTYTLYLVP
jgi:hypothetical protein